MAELKEPAHGIWTGYGSPVQMANSRFGHPGALDPILANAATAAPPAPSPHSARPRTDAAGYPYTRYPQDDTDVYGRHHSTSSASGVPHPSLTTHQSYPNLKRTYSQTEQHQQHQQPPQSQVPPYGDMVQDMRNEDGSKVNVNQGHKLLSFRRVADKHTIVDRHGRIQQFDLSAQLHGMFFLSEMPASSSDGSVLQPELTCYRRNLFQISGTLITPRGQLSVVNEGGETVAVSSTELTISAIESVDGHPIRLIVIPWKTPPPNSPEVAQNPDQEPVPLPLIPFQDDGSEAEGEYAVYPIGWRRLQFRIATANNGRRKELQQHFVLHLKAIATLTNGSKVVLAESTTAPIVVRGRSPRNFQARKEIPLLGSSAGSRGQALVETGMGIVAGPLTVKTQDKARAMALELPRSSFTFTAAPKMPPSPMSMRSNSYPAWNTPQMPLPPASVGAYPTTSMANEPYQKLPVSGSPHYTAEPQEMPMQPGSSMPSVQLSLVANEQQQPNIRTQYAYVQGTSAPPPQLSLPTAGDAGGLSVPRYVDNNARPAKSPRHANHDSVHSATSLSTSNDTPGEYRYGPASYLGVGGGTSELSPHSQHGAQHSPSQPPPPQQQGRPQQQHSQPQSQQQSPSQPLPLPHPQQQQQHQGAPQQHQGQSAYGATSHDASGNSSVSNPPSVSHPPPREYYPSSTSWAQPPGDSNQAPYANGESRHYSFPDQYKAGHQVKNGEALPQPHSYAPRGSFDATTMNHYSWSAA